MIRFIILILCIACSCFAQYSPNNQRSITVDDIFNPKEKLDFQGNYQKNVQWMPDHVSYIFWNKYKLEWIVKSVITRQYSSLYSVSQFKEACISSSCEIDYFDTILSSVLWHPKFTSFAFIYKQNVYYCDILMQKVSQLTHDQAEEKELSFSPDGKWLSFIRNYDLYVISLSNFQEIRCTTNGSNKLHNGYLDWVYQEEIYGRGNFKGYWWNPTSSYIAFFQMDLSNMDSFNIVDHTKIEYHDMTLLYPKAGRPNAQVSLGVYSIEMQDIQWIPVQGNKTESLLFVDISWNPQGDMLLYQVQNRQQTWLELRCASVIDSFSSTIIREESPAWVDVLGSPLWIDDTQFLWRSARDGYYHIYQYTCDEEQENWQCTQLTKGKWDVRNICGYSNNVIYYASTEQSPIEVQIYALNCETKITHKLTNEPGIHNAMFNANNTLFIDTWSNAETPYHVDIKNNHGELIYSLHTPKLSALQEIHLQPTKFFTIKNSRNFDMPAMFIYPDNFDTNKKYPVLIHVYSGPQTSNVQNKWGRNNTLWHHALAAKGYLVCFVDNQSSSNQGAVSAWVAYKRLGTTELSDIEDAVSWMKQQSYIDPTRIGIWGWSYGGYMTSYALTHSKLFKMGIAVAPVTDWRHYDSIYTERFMDTPQNNTYGYLTSSVVYSAANLHGKFLLVHGTMDDNVHLQNSMQFIYALQRAGKRFNLMLYPKSDHSIRRPELNYHLYRMMTEYIIDNL